MQTNKGLGVAVGATRVVLKHNDLLTWHNTLNGFCAAVQFVRNANGYWRAKVLKRSDERDVLPHKGKAKLSSRYLFYVGGAQVVWYVTEWTNDSVTLETAQELGAAIELNIKGVA